jgi:hypothetical protein
LVFATILQVTKVDIMTSWMELAFSLTIMPVINIEGYEGIFDHKKREATSNANSEIRE